MFSPDPLMSVRYQHPRTLLHDRLECRKHRGVEVVGRSAARSGSMNFTAPGFGVVDQIFQWVIESRLTYIPGSDAR